MDLQRECVRRYCSIVYNIYSRAIITNGNFVGITVSFTDGYSVGNYR
jgi:hypothetical protein